VRVVSAILIFFLEAERLQPEAAAARSSYEQPISTSWNKSQAEIKFFSV